MVIEMRPSRTIRNLPDVTPGNPERAGDICDGDFVGEMRANDPDVVLVQLLLTEGVAPALPGRVLNVLSLCADKEMVRPDTEAVVAPVTDHLPVWDGAVVQLPR